MKAHQGGEEGAHDHAHDEARRTGPEGTFRPRATAAVTPVKAPTLIKPAWPRLSSPSTPTVRFRDRAMTT